MGNLCETYHQEQGEKEEKQLPAVESFQLCSKPVLVQEKHRRMLLNIKKYCDFPEMILTEGLCKWYQSAKYNFYLYGQLKKNRPIGICFFYIINAFHVSTPVCICTEINEHFIFSDSTLIMYQDESFYFGSIVAQLLDLPRAEGLGLLVSKEFIYEGEFKHGVPHGFGKYKTKFSELTGEFIQGLPTGRIVQRSANGLFIGDFATNGMRDGYLVTPQNERKQQTILAMSRITMDLDSII